MHNLHLATRHSILKLWFEVVSITRNWRSGNIIWKKCKWLVWVRYNNIWKCSHLNLLSSPASRCGLYAIKPYLYNFEWDFPDARSCTQWNCCKQKIHMYYSLSNNHPVLHQSIHTPLCIPLRWPLNSILDFLESLFCTIPLLYPVTFAAK